MEHDQRLREGDGLILAAEQGAALKVMHWNLTTMLGDIQSVLLENLFFLGYPGDGIASGQCRIRDAQFNRRLRRVAGRRDKQHN